MIQLYLKNILADALPSLEWTIMNKTAADNTGAVYFEGGSMPGEYDVPKRDARYMVFISSSDFAFAEFAAMKSMDLLHKRAGEIITVDYYRDEEWIESKHFKLLWISAAGDINPLGIKNGVMDYSINFDAQLIELKEEI